jgi:hypothetical protein
MKFKDMLHDVARAAGALAAAAANLENKNLADIIEAGAAKLRQATDHPDVDNVNEQSVRSASEREANPMDPGPQPKAAPFPGGIAETGEPNPMQG